jgi:Tfp pilus assembly PilM family ATPase
MFGLFGKRAYPIGVDLSNDSVKLVQLANSGRGISLVAGSSENRPETVEPGSANWQRWAVDAIREATAGGRFRGKQVVAAIPANQVFIDHIKIGAPYHDTSRRRNQDSRTDVNELPRAAFSKIKQKLPFEPDDGMVKYIPTEQDNALVIATERKIINRHLAIYEKAGLVIKSISVWPMALAACYSKFFGRRKSDLDAVVMLLDVETNCTNLVICRHKNPLFACSIPTGARHLADEKMVTRLVLELTASRRHFSSIQHDAQIERLIFLSGRAVDAEIYTTIAKQLEIKAQMGDCLAAAEIANPYRSGIDRRDSHVNWATAFGLSLS